MIGRLRPRDMNDRAADFFFFKKHVKKASKQCGSSTTSTPSFSPDSILDLDFGAQLINGVLKSPSSTKRKEKEFTTKVKEGGYDTRVNETVNVITARTSEIGQKTWGIMEGVMAMASQKVEEYTQA
ncbi:hypothetical protein V6N13_117962 [Hibiscus sabdariffa]